MPDSSSNRGVMIVLAYLWPLAIVPLLLEKDDADVQWHAKHGLVLLAAELLLLLGLAVLTGLVGLATFAFGCALSMFMILIWVAILGVHIVAMIKGMGGTRLIIPGISEYANRF
jgi:small-conductance mechanosensitive channel